MSLNVVGQMVVDFGVGQEAALLAQFDQVLQPRAPRLHVLRLLLAFAHVLLLLRGKLRSLLLGDLLGDLLGRRHRLGRGLLSGLALRRQFALIGRLNFAGLMLGVWFRRGFDRRLGDRLRLGRGLRMRRRLRLLGQRPRIGQRLGMGRRFGFLHQRLGLGCRPRASRGLLLRRRGALVQRFRLGAFCFRCRCGMLRFVLLGLGLMCCHELVLSQ
jgi:hypothetical protein